MDAFLLNTYGAVNSGLLFIPFAIGISLIYRNLKEIDVSIDGVVVISGIACAVVWNATGSYFFSIISGMAVGVFCSFFVASLQVYFTVPSLMSGLIFSLIAHTISVFWVGESITLNGTTLIRAVTYDSVVFEPWHIGILLLCYAFPVYFYNSHLGLSIRKLGNGNKTNLYYSEAKLKFLSYALTGAIYGVGASIYVHSMGTASGEVTFVFLVYALTAYLLVSKLFPVLVKGLSWIGDRVEATLFPKKFTVAKNWVSMIISHEALMAPTGAILLEVISTNLIVLSTLTKSPQIWKLTLSLALLIALSSWPAAMRKKDPSSRKCKLLSGVSIAGMEFSYEFVGGTRLIFSNANVEFSSGLNILMGPNGSGKTTLLRLIAGEYLPKAGDIFHNGKEITCCAVHDRSVYILLQNPLHSLVPEMTVQENLFLAWSDSTSFFVGRKANSLQKMLEFLDKSGLKLTQKTDDSFWASPVESLSGGQAYCVAIYAAVLSGREVILADEPTTGLDENNYEMVRNALKYLINDKQRTVIIVTHDERLKDITWNKYYIRDNEIQSESNWWDARYSETFFSSVYRLGDDSTTGFLNNRSMDIFQRTQREVELIVQIIGDPDAKTILDCPSGYGRHSIELAKRGASVWGVDISPSFIKEARDHAAIHLPNQKRPIFMEGDMRQLPNEINKSSFDCCLNMFFAFGFFNEEGNRQTLKEYYRVLKDGGILIIHTDVNPDLISSGSYGDPKSRLLDNGMKLTIDEKYNEENKRLEGSWTIMDDGVMHKSQRYSVRIYQHIEMVNMLKEIGFDGVDIDYPDELNKQEVIYIATK